MSRETATRAAPSDFPRYHHSTSPDRAEVLMVVLVNDRVGRRADPVPTMFAWGNRDRFVSRAAAKLCRHLSWRLFIAFAQFRAARVVRRGSLAPCPGDRGPGHGCRMSLAWLLPVPQCCPRGVRRDEYQLLRRAVTGP